MAKQKSEAELIKNRVDRIRDTLVVSTDSKNKKLREYPT